MTNKRLSIGLLMTLVVSMAIAPALSSQNAFADTNGPYSPTANQLGDGADWTDPTNVYADDSSYAQTFYDEDPERHAFGGFDISVPAGATITKVTVSVDADRISSCSGSDRKFTVRLSDPTLVGAPSEASDFIGDVERTGVYQLAASFQTRSAEFTNVLHDASQISNLWVGIAANCDFLIDHVTVDVDYEFLDPDAPIGNDDCDDEFATALKARPVITSIVPTIDGIVVNWAQQELDADISIWIWTFHVGCFYPVAFDVESNGAYVATVDDVSEEEDNSGGTYTLTNLECGTNYDIEIIAEWLSSTYGPEDDEEWFDGFFTGKYVESGVTSVSTLDCIKQGGGGNDEWKTAPTFGIDWNTKSQLVDEGVTFNRNSYDVDNNFHTDFAKQPVIVGTSNIVAMKVYANYDLKWVEFIFDVPEVGAANEARATVFVPMTWMDTDEIDQDNVEVIQDVNFINADKVEVYRTSVTCTDEDVEENCDLIAAKVLFNEQPASGVFAFKAVDERNRSTTTYFNDGIEVLGESLNPLEVVLVATPDKAHRGLVELTQVGDRYDNLWSSEDGYLYTMNSFGTFILVQAPDREARVDGGTPDRNHSAWDEVLNYEEAKAKSYWNADLNKSELPPSFAYEFPAEDSRTQFLAAHDMLSFARGAN